MARLKGNGRRLQATQRASAPVGIAQPAQARSSGRTVTSQAGQKTWPSTMSARQPAQRSGQSSRNKKEPAGPSMRQSSGLARRVLSGDGPRYEQGAERDT